MPVEMTVAENAVLDGYRLIREIGRGGFGVVWLCQSETLGEYHALKWIPRSANLHLEQELEGLEVYRRGVGRNSPRFLPIEHIRLTEEGLFYVMPLADGPNISPESEDWYPLTLATLIARQKDKGQWFAVSEIHEIMDSVLRAAECLSTAGLLHRDIKPENIIYLQGSPCLSDYGLTANDNLVVSRKGSPAYLAPSWYLESSGNPDMWACACVLYTLLTGNLPDKMGRTAYFWPPKGEGYLSKEERDEWLRLHRVIHRATAEHSEERFLDFSRFLRGVQGRTGKVNHARSVSRRIILSVTLICAILALSLYLWTAGRREMAFSTPPISEASISSNSGLVSPHAVSDVGRNNAAEGHPPTSKSPDAHEAQSLSADGLLNYWKQHGQTIKPKWNGNSYIIDFVDQLYVKSPSGEGLVIIADSDKPKQGDSTGFKLADLRGRFRVFLGCVGQSRGGSIHIGEQSLSFSEKGPKQVNVRDGDVYFEYEVGFASIKPDDVIYLAAQGNTAENEALFMYLDYLRLKPEQ